MPGADDAPLDPDAAFAALAAAVAQERAARGGALVRDDFGDAEFAVPLTLTQLDADAMNDRLQAFVHREVVATVPGAAAEVSFQDARPESTGVGDLDHQETWHNVKPTFKLDLTRPAPTARDLAQWVAFFPRFQAVIGADGRPEGWRDVEAGASE